MTETKPHDDQYVTYLKNFRWLAWIGILLASTVPILILCLGISWIVESARTPPESMPSYIEAKMRLDAVKRVLSVK